MLQKIEHKDATSQQLLKHFHVLEERADAVKLRLSGEYEGLEYCDASLSVPLSWMRKKREATIQLCRKLLNTAEPGAEAPAQIHL